MTQPVSFRIPDAICPSPRSPTATSPPAGSRTTLPLKFRRSCCKALLRLPEPEPSAARRSSKPNRPAPIGPALLASVQSAHIYRGRPCFIRRQEPLAIDSSPTTRTASSSRSPMHFFRRCMGQCGARPPPEYPSFNWRDPHITRLAGLGARLDRFEAGRPWFPPLAHRQEERTD